MANIVGEPLSDYVAGQINVRQKAHGSGTLNNPRTPEYIAYLNSKTAWVKMASSVLITPERLKNETDSSSHSINPIYAGSELAKNFILFGGMSELKNGKLTPRGTSLLDNNIYGWNTGTYSVNPFATETYSPSGEFGLSPMPGIESVDVKCQNRGSTKKVSVKLKCYSPEQFKIIDLLYLRIGYTMFIEWGWAPYLDNNGNLVNDPITLIEESGQGFFEVGYWKGKSYIDFSKKINSYRNKKNGNYDGLLCKVTNFSWTFSQDGSYDIDIQLISLGDVIESIKTNVTPSYKLTTDINASYILFNDAYSDEETKESPPSPVNNILSAYFFLQKLITYKNGQNGTNKYWVEKQIPCKIDGTEIELFGIFVQDPNSTELIVNEEWKDFIIKSNMESWLNTNFPGATNIPDLSTYENTNSPGTYYNIEDVGFFIPEYIIRVKSIVDPASLNTSGQKKTDIIYLNYNTREDDEDVINDMGFYIRFGHLLDFIKERIIPRIKGSNINTPILDIDSSPLSNEMYTFPYQVSLDPRVCIVHTEEKINTKEYYTSLPVWKKEGAKYAYPMNIYLNVNKINEIISSNLDDKGNLALFDFISSICTELNKALGGVNNLEPIIDEVTNQLKIIDGSHSAEKKPDQYALELYGYNLNNPVQSGTTVSNFVRDFSIKTEITNDFATMATIGSTAGGYVKGTENTMFSKWNNGIIDRFKEELVPADKDALEKYNGRDDPNAAYYEEFWIKRYSAFGLTIPLDIEYDVLTGDQPALDDTIIDKNVAIVTEFYKYCQFKLQELDKKYASTSNGFVPISLSLTLDGLSGIKIYNALNVVTRVLPSNYPDALKFIIKGVNHKISKNDWETNIETVVIANSDSDNTKIYQPNTIFITPSTNTGGSGGGLATQAANTPITPSGGGGLATQAANTPITPSGGGGLATQAAQTTRPSRPLKAGDLYTWVKGGNSTVPDFPDGYAADVLKYNVPNNLIPIPVTPLTKTFEGWKTRRKSDGTVIRVWCTQYKTTKLSLAATEDFYKKVLAKIGAPVTLGNMIFLKAWRQAEGANATYNPFSSSQIKNNIESSYNTFKVQNYFSLNDGIDATVTTMTNGKYPNIIKAFRKGIPDQVNGKKLANLLQRKATFNQSSVDALINSW